MYKKIIIFYLLLSCSLSQGQSKNYNQKSILIYSDDNGYMQPFIEKTIKDLINSDTEISYFKSVNSFNRFITDNKYQAELSDLILTQKPSNIRSNTYYSDSEKQIRTRIYNYLKDYDYFLTIKTNTLGELIEFQFQLYKTVTDGNNSYNISDQVLSVENFFINPKDKDYKIEITNAVQRLFKNSNRVPDAELKIFNQYFYAGLEHNITLPIDSKIVFDGSNSGDRDTEVITYHWRNIIDKHEKYQTTKKIIFQENLPIQSVTVKESGNYKVGFKVFDGIEFSKEVILNVTIKDKPFLINVEDTIVYSRKLQTIIPVKSNKIFYGKIYVSNYFNEEIPQKVILSKNRLSQRTLTMVDTSYLIQPLRFKRDLYSFSYIEFDPGNSEYATSETRKYYLYNVDSDGNLHKEVPLKHYYLVRSAFSLRYNFTMSTIDFNREDEKTNGFSYSSISLGIYLTNRLEVEFTIPISTRSETFYNGYFIEYPHTFETSVNYLFFNSKNSNLGEIIPYIGCNIKGYNVKGEFEKEYSYSYSAGPKVGCEYTLSSREIFDLNLRANMNYDLFTETKFSEIYNVGFGVSALLRF